jgi:hypothetical protein
MVMAFVNLEHQHIVWNFILILSSFFPPEDLEMVNFSNLKSVRIGVIMEVVDCCIHFFSFVPVSTQLLSKSHSHRTMNVASLSVFVSSTELPCM